MATLRCSICDDDFVPDAGGGGYWGDDRLVCSRCEQTSYGPLMDAMNAVAAVLQEAGVIDAPDVAGEVIRAILKSGNVIIGFTQLRERNQAFQSEIEDLKAELGHH